MFLASEYCSKKSLFRYLSSDAQRREDVHIKIVAKLLDPRSDLVEENLLKASIPLLYS
jgi:hypothetical protein